MPSKTALEKFEREYKKGIGVETDLNHHPFLLEATRDNIMNFADAVGDNNPLWINEEHARKTRFPLITAPPTFLYNISHGSAPAASGTTKLPPMDLGLFYAGAELEFFRPVRRGDQFTVTGKATGITAKKSQSLGPVLFAT